MSDSRSYFVTVASGLEAILESELIDLGLEEVKAVGSGAYFTGTLEQAYRVCLWSRVANRVLLPLGEFPANSPEELYRYVRTLNWAKHMDVHDTLAVDFFSANSNITHTRYGALKVKDAIVDQFREATGERPNVERETPSIRINVYVYRNKARIALDLAGASLHRRGYRDDMTTAPMKENLAAALLYGMKWPAMAKQGMSFCDPLCGSGTILIEAAMIAADIAPQLTRSYFGFAGWKGHQKIIWQKLLQEAHDRAEAGKAAMSCAIAGSDKSTKVVGIAEDNIRRAGLQDFVSVCVANIEQIHYLNELPHGLVLSNPPYGVRLDKEGSIGRLYGLIGRSLKTYFPGWTVGLFTGSPDLLHRMRLKTGNVLKCNNGGIECRLMQAEIPESEAKPAAITGSDAARAIWGAAEKKTQRAEMFANRLRKNFKPLEKWTRAKGISCYRVYDADLPEYAVVVDVYEADQRYVHVQEYRAPANIDRDIARQRLDAILGEIPDVLGCDPEAIRLKQRKRQSGAQQYEKLEDFKSAGRDTHIVEEYGARFEVNLSDYLDTGIFSDHRKIRQWIAKASRGKRFLNLFAYTGTASVQAALGGATSTTTIDMSNNYLAWAQRNMALNPSVAEGQHEFIREDCLEWLRENSGEAQFDLILLDPPTFSNSKSMDKDWDVQRDHVRVIRQAMRLLSKDGLLIFSNNFRKFRLDEKNLDRNLIENRTRDSIPRDYARNQKIHQCYFIRHRQ